ncbi:hypothetical protein CDV36_001945 [Fusarium kuroshium]|uniref:Uncharacterized protein n=1 Tax=Fusarium kuroshium TaxID=2010991 RepID=A0A3M2SMD4_9HYPO|nr:hypothetical protein CDV36_001945 [Fusarium kuroshium]
MSLGDPKMQISTETDEVKLQSQPIVSYEINFVRDEKETSLFCCKVPAYPGDAPGPDDHFGQWYDRAGALRFLEKMPPNPWAAAVGEDGTRSSPSFTFVGGFGNGTLHPLSVDCALFTKIMRVLHLPDRIREVIGSIHGVFAQFIEYHGDEPKSLPSESVILLSTSKAPTREIFCALRIVPQLASMTCLLFDDQEADLRRVVDLVCGSSRGLAWRNPVAFLTVLLRECGRTSELKRGPLDNNILGAEILTKSTPWQKLRKTPNDFVATTNQLNASYNALLFVARAVDAEVDAWQFLQRMAKDEQLRPWLKAAASNRQWSEMLDNIDFEMAHTHSRKTQIGCLKERTGIQINAISNLIAHQETTQTNLIAVIALIFAPASLTASIFSAGLFTTNDHSWVAYIAWTLPVTAVTVMAGLYFLQLQILARAVRFFIKSYPKETDEEDSTGRLGSTEMA